MDDRYWIRKNSGRWNEVTKHEFITHERMNGFYPKEGDGLATGGFIKTVPQYDYEIEGKITSDGKDIDDLLELPTE